MNLKALESWQRVTLAFVLVGIVLPVAGRLVAGPKGAWIQVEWKPSVDEATRLRLEPQFRLESRRKLEDTYTWRYDLVDPSTRNIRALVNDPNVEDTHRIDRHAYTLESAPRTSRRLRFANGDAIVGAADGLAMLLFVLAVLVLATRTSIVHLLQRAVPEIDATTAGIFRIVFGSAVLAFFATHRVDASWLSATFDLEVETGFHAAVLEWLSRRPHIVDLLTPWLLTTGLAFTLGIFTRVSYALFVVGVVTWAFVRVSLDSLHPLGTFVLTLVALLPSQWGDALSVDAWLARTSNRTTDANSVESRAYGYSVWIPGLLFGIGFAAAAWAKLFVPATPATWILNGTIKYHFVTDSNLAPFDWGLRLAGHPWIAVLISFLAIATEAVVVTGAFVRSERYRLLMGAAAVSLVGGFWLFMGHFWPGWWILLLGFLPWKTIGRTSRAHLSRRSAPPSGPAISSPAVRLATAAQVAVIIAVIAQQFVMSTVQIELAPMFSWYPMYSGTYDGPQDYASRRPPRYRIVASTDTGNVELLRCSPHEEFVRQFEAAVNGSAEASMGVWRALGGCTDDLGAVRQVTLVGHLEAFDWDRREFTTLPLPTLGPLATTAHEGQSITP
jgi:hypothetical protein